MKIYKTVFLNEEEDSSLIINKDHLDFIVLTIEDFACDNYFSFSIKSRDVYKLTQTLNTFCQDIEFEKMSKECLVQKPL